MCGQVLGGIAPGYGGVKFFLFDKKLKLVYLFRNSFPKFLEAREENSVGDFHNSSQCVLRRTVLKVESSQFQPSPPAAIVFDKFRVLALSRGRCDE
jgi:hypothetical protein